MARKSLIDLSKPPKMAVHHLCADYAELLCLVNQDQMVSQSYVLDRIHDSRDLNFEYTEMVEELVPEYSDLEGSETDWEEEGSRIAEVDDAVAARVQDWFQHLQWRSNAFAHVYPFHVSHDGWEITRKSDVSPQQKLYIFLLLASNLRYINNPTILNKLATHFEVASTLALNEYLSPSGSAFMFGLNQLNTGPYNGTLWDRINRLAHDIGDQPNLNHQAHLSNKQGERGMDVVGWIPLKDRSPGCIIVTGQCACGYENWSDKQLTSHSTRWKNYILFTVQPINSAFIPHCFRNASGSWYDPTQINDSILFDRLRITSLIGDRRQDLSNKLPYDVVDRVLQTVETAV